MSKTRHDTVTVAPRGRKILKNRLLMKEEICYKMVNTFPLLFGVRYRIFKWSKTDFLKVIWRTKG